MRALVATLGIAAASALINPTSAAQHLARFAPASAASATAPVPAGGGEASAIDEMLRGESGRARRWARRPSLVVVTSVLRFEGGVQRDYVATAGALTHEESDALARDLSEGLTALTAGAFDSFASVRLEPAEAGSRVTVMRDGEIVAARFDGIAAALNAVGYGGRLARPDGTITSGTVMLDHQYDRTDRLSRLLRIHELGHALGYNHVTSRRSIMNPTLGAEPTDFDRTVARLAFTVTPP